MKKRILSFLLVLVTVASLFPTKASAAHTTYITVKENVPMWSSYSSNSQKIHTIPNKGATVHVADSHVNEAGNLWYLMDNGDWIYSGNVEKHMNHDFKGGICTLCNYEYPYAVIPMTTTTAIVTNKDGASIWNRPYSVNSTKESLLPYGCCLDIVGKATNADGNLWYTTAQGTWVYSGNIDLHTKHNYKGGYCTECGYEFPYVVTTMDNIPYVVTNKDGAPRWSRPYSVNTTEQPRAAYGTVMSITGKTTNADGNVWYRTFGGYWIYSGNVAEYQPPEETFTVVYDANGGKSAPPNGTITYGGTFSDVKPVRDGYTFLGWSTSNTATAPLYKSDAPYMRHSDVVLYAVWEKNEEICTNHDYTGGICNDCGYEYPYTITSMTTTTYYTTNEVGTKIWDRPYSNHSNTIETLAYGIAIDIVGKTINEDGNLWYKTSKGYWVYSGNVSTSSNHVCTSVQCGFTTTTYAPLSRTSHSKTVSYDELCSCGAVVDTVTNTTKEEHDFTHGTCDDCGYTWIYPIYDTGNKDYQVSNTDGAAVYSMPYADSTKKYTLAYKDTLTATYWTSNVYGNEWYQLSDGNWIYKGNIAEYVEPLYDPVLSYDDRSMVDYVAQENYQNLFGGYNYAITFVNHLAWYDKAAYSLKNWKSIFGMIGSKDFGETFMTNPKQCQNALAGVVDSMCDKKTVDYITKGEDKGMAALKIIYKLSDVDFADPIFTAIEDADKLLQANQDYSDDLSILNQLAMNTSSTSLVGTTTTQLQASYTYAYADAVLKILEDHGWDGVKSLTDMLLTTKAGLVDSILQFTLSNIKSIDVVNDVVFLSTMRCEVILEFREAAKKLASGGYVSQADVDNYKFLFDMAKAFTIAEYEAMQSYYKSNTMEYNYLDFQLERLEDCTYDDYAVAVPYSAFQ